MKKIDFGSGRILANILYSVGPMLTAQILSLLYNIVDRIYIARIPQAGVESLAGIGLCFPLISVIAAFTNLFGTGGAPLCSIELGKGNRQKAGEYMNEAFVLLSVCAVVLGLFCMLFLKPLLFWFGASENTFVYAGSYMQIYLSGTLFSMISLGMNAFINAQGYPGIGMTSVLIGALSNILLDPLFIFTFQLGIAGAALATVLSQALSFLFVLWFLRRKTTMLRLDFSQMKRLNRADAGQITGLGTAGWMMQMTNTAVQIASNSMLSGMGGDLSISIMTMISSIRQILDTPVLAIGEGAAPVLSYSYGADRPEEVLKGITVLSALGLGYTLIMWMLVMAFPSFFIGIFNEDPALSQMAVPCLRLYFAAFIFQAFQFCGQSVFKALNRKKEAIFFSIFRKIVIGLPGILLLPQVMSEPMMGVFAAEPVSNVIGGLVCYGWMLATLVSQLKRKATKQNGRSARNAQMNAKSALKMEKMQMEEEFGEALEGSENYGD